MNVETGRDHPVDRRALFVGWDDQLLERVCAETATRGIRVDRVAHARAAVEAARSGGVDVVVTDPSCSLPEAIAVARDVEAAAAGIKVIAACGAATQQDLVVALRAHVFACFTAPIDVHELAAMVRLAAVTLEWRQGIEVLSGLPHWVTLRVASRMVDAERVVRFMTEYRTDVPESDRAGLITAFREMLINCMEHGAGFDPLERIEVSSARTERAVVFYMRDPGPGFSRDDLAHAAVAHGDDPIAHVDRRAALGLRPGGFGMRMTRDLVDELVYNERGNEVILVKYIDAAAAQAIVP